MKCPTCNSAMVALFYSHVCDRCNPPAGASLPKKQGPKLFSVGDMARLVNVCDIAIRPEMEGKIVKITTIETTDEGVDYYLQTAGEDANRWWAPIDNLEPVERKASFAVGDRVWLPDPSLDGINFPQGSIGTVKTVANYGYDVVLDDDPNTVPWAVSPMHLEELS